MKAAFTMGALNFLAYLLWVFNYRAVAQARYIESIISDVCISALGFTIFKKIQAAQTIAERIGFAVGGGLASWAGIALTTRIFGQ